MYTLNLHIHVLTNSPLDRLFCHIQWWRNTWWRMEPRTETRASPARVLLRRRPPRRPSLLRTRPEELGETKRGSGPPLTGRWREGEREREREIKTSALYDSCNIRDVCFVPYGHDTVSESTGDHMETPRRNAERTGSYIWSCTQARCLLRWCHRLWSGKRLSVKSISRETTPDLTRWKWWDVMGVFVLVFLLFISVCSYWSPAGELDLRSEAVLGLLIGNPFFL